MPRSTFTHPLFGDVTFKTAHEDVWVRGDKITFIDGFNPKDITDIQIPQLAGVTGAHGGKLKFHKRGHAQLAMAFSDIEQLGLLMFIKSCEGSVNFRLRKPTNGSLSKLPSNHAFGIAIDLNASDKQLGASIAPVAPVFEALGFKWGVAFNDPMHFEVEEWVENPKSVAHVLSGVLA
jgi:hypothetical protein